MKVLWLSSWYPNPLHPYDGDFIQRHARAVSAYTPVTVFYVAQWGEAINVTKGNIIEQKIAEVSERIILFHYRKTGFRWLDKIIYNYRYYRAYKKAIIQYFSKEGKPDIVHVHIPMKAGVIGRWIKSKWGIPYILSEQSSLYDKSAPGNFFARNYLHRQSVKEIFQNARMVTNVSATVGEQLKEIFQLPVVRTIHNTVNTNYFHYTKLAPSKFRFIHVSTLTHQKNVEGMLRAVTKLAGQRKDFEFVLVGPLNPKIKKLIDQHALQSIVHCTGEIRYQDVAKEMQKASALVLFSRHENFPCVIVEALCCGLPCIASRVGGVAEAVNEKSGILVSSENEEELFLAMNRMIKVYHQFSREQISADAINKYSYLVIGKQFMDIYNEILK